MNSLDIAGKRRTQTPLGRLIIFALLGLMLWFGSVASVSAQSMPNTSPCLPLGQHVPTGWTSTTPLSTLCSDTNFLGGDSNPANVADWHAGPIPATPSGQTTFVSLAPAPNLPSDLSTTLTGLTAGATYNLNFYYIGNYSNQVTQTCPVTVTLNGVVTTIPAPNGTTWTRVPLPALVATGPTATVKFSVPGILCDTSIAVQADAIVPVGTDVSVTKTVSPTGTVAAGSVVTYTLTTRNAGPTATTNVRLRDTPDAGLDCATPSPTATCAATGGATCSGATVPVSTLTGAGVTIPNLPVNGQVVVTMQCKVIATGI